MKKFKNTIKRLLPLWLVFTLANAGHYFQYAHYLGFKKKCAICSAPLDRFIPLKDIADGLFMGDVHIQGKRYSVSDYETLNLDNFLCPICGSQDKARLYALFLKQHLSVSNQSSKPKFDLIHFAPEGGLPELIKQYPQIRYRSADLLREDVDDKADLTKLPYPKNSFDVFICSHILEHIPDDDKALTELHRILKKGGWGILMVPLMTTLSATYEDKRFTSEKDRLKHFGQTDHVRIYAKKSFLAKVKKHGFKIKQITNADFSPKLFDFYGIDKKSVLYVVSK